MNNTRLPFSDFITSCIGTYKPLLLGCICIAQLGCLSAPVKTEAIPDDPRFAPVYAHSLPSGLSGNGSIYSAATAVDLYQRRAHQTGDILTVLLNESTSASKSSGTSFAKSSAASVADQTVAGSGFLGTGITLNGNVTSSVDFDGASDADQSNQLNGSITVTVADVLANGNLQIRGEKWLQLARGREYIRISGLVRKEDITPSNTIDSTRIADVRITYSGTGELADANEAGWLTRFFVGNVWPF